VTKIIKQLLAINKVKLLEMIRNLNSKYEHAPVAQWLMKSILPGLDCEEYVQIIKKENESD